MMLTIRSTHLILQPEYSRTIIFHGIINHNIGNVFVTELTLCYGTTSLKQKQ